MRRILVPVAAAALLTMGGAGIAFADTGGQGGVQPDDQPAVTAASSWHPESADPGDAVQFWPSIHGTQGDSQGGHLTVTFDSEVLTFTSVAGTPGDCTHADGQIDCDLDVHNRDKGYTVNFTVNDDTTAKSTSASAIISNGDGQCDETAATLTINQPTPPPADDGDDNGGTPPADTGDTGGQNDATTQSADTGGNAGSKDLDCADFANHDQAQTVYDQDTSDPNRLDGDDDGVACESLIVGNDGGNGTVTPTGTDNGVTQVSMVPSGSVDTGSGSTAGIEDGWLYGLGGALVLAGAGIGLSAAARRRLGQR